MPDALTLHRSDAGLSQTQLIERERRPLPSHEIQGGNFRQWAVAVCQAEVNHRERDYERVEALLGIQTDRWDFPNDPARGQFPHEAHAGAALLWMSHLQAHETEKRAPFHFIPWCDWRAKERAAWLERRRILWRGFLKEVRAYQAARAELTAFWEGVK